MRNQIALANAKVHRTTMTAAESVLWHNVRASRFEGFKFKRQTPIGPFIADFTCRSAMIAVELDGDTHGATTSYDERRTLFLETFGWRVVRYTNADVMTNLQGVLTDLRCRLTPPLPGPLPSRGEEE